MVVGDWLLIETFDGLEAASVLAVGSAPRQWKSLARTLPSQLLPMVVEAYERRAPTVRELPRSRHAWSRGHAHAIPLVGPSDRVHGLHFWVGQANEPPRRPRLAPFVLDGRSRRFEMCTAGLGPAFEPERSVWVGAEMFTNVERFDGALDLAAAINRAVPGSRWHGDICVRTPIGLRTGLLAARNITADPRRWHGLILDITDTVPPQGKSFEATTVDTLVNANPGLYLAVVDTAHVRLIRWISTPVPGLRWSGATDERTMPHPDDRARILAARTDILSGSPSHTVAGLRLVAEDGGWLTVDAEVSPLPYGPPDAAPPEFALVRMELRPD
ncbi:GAF domain-containing protein [Nocardia sp. NPDC051570]|uniref:GAF domain-containing protein n=1 Tax=Nocardia sp. NPDC051570 TaxID=3364324 RepID=UPI0037A5784E